MARIDVPLSQFTAGDFPEICARTGAPADGLVDVSYSTRPPWVHALVLVGPIAWVIGSVFAAGSVKGQLPISRPVFERWKRLGRLAVFLGTLAVLLAVAGLLRSRVLLFLAVPTLLGSVMVATARGVMFVGGRLKRHSGTVVLTRVHDDFATATERASRTIEL